MDARELMTKLGKELKARNFKPSPEATMKEFEPVAFESDQHSGNFRSLFQVMEEMKIYARTGEKIRNGEMLAVALAERIAP